MRGTIKTVVEQRYFAFIRSDNGVEYFFHKEDFLGHWDDLVDDFKNGMKIEVDFEMVQSQKGPRAAGVTRLDGGR